MIPTLGYPAQFFTGVLAVPAIIQNSRLNSDPGAVKSLTHAISSDFAGGFQDGNRFVPVTGQLDISPGPVGSAIGEFRGHDRNGDELNVPIDGAITLGREVFGSPRRRVIVTGLADTRISGANQRNVELRGTISRPFLNWYQAPRDDSELDRLHGKLSQRFDIACVFTWIAGLLNFMAIWDAYDGPAYGYGDERPEDEEDDSDA